MHIRDAVIEDAYDLARLQSLAAHGIMEYGYGDLVAGVDSIELVSRLFEMGIEPYCHRNCVVAEDDGRVVGKLLSYGCDDVSSVAGEDPFITPERLAILTSCFAPTPVSWHVDVVAVFPDYQGRGLGREFVDIAKDQCRRNGFDRLSLHCFETSEAALRLYKRCGFKAVDRVAIPDEAHLSHLGKNFLMVCDVPPCEPY